MEALAGGGGVLAEAHLLRACKGPADKGPAGPFRGECYLAYFSCI